MSNHEDAIFIRNFSIVVVGILIIGILAFVLAKIVNRTFPDSPQSDVVVAARLAPIGRVNVGSETILVGGSPVLTENTAVAETLPGATDAAAGDPGKRVYDSLCFTCHAQGITGAPKYGDMASWEARIATGRDALLANTIAGFTGAAGVMPARGGNPALSDEEVGAAVDYMMAAVGGNANAPAAAAAPAAAPAPEPAAAAPLAGNARGKEVYDAACFVCHAPGAAGAPKFGDAAAWAPHIEQGMEVLYERSIKGFMGNAGMMPPKGGRPDFGDDDVKAAVDYMVSNAQ